VRFNNQVGDVMRDKLIIGIVCLLIGMLLGGVGVYAGSTKLGAETIWNNVYNSADTTLDIRGI